jgi:hypothetical protein
MKLIKTSNQKEIDYLLKEGHSVKNTEGDLKVFEVEEDVIIPDFSPAPLKKKIKTDNLKKNDKPKPSKRR